MAEIFYNDSKEVRGLKIGMEVYSGLERIGKIIGIVKKEDCVISIIVDQFFKKNISILDVKSTIELSNFLANEFPDSTIYLNTDLDVLKNAMIDMSLYNIDIFGTKNIVISNDVLYINKNEEVIAPITDKVISQEKSCSEEKEPKISKHYGKGVQPLDLMKECGAFEGFCTGNIIKYAFRMNKKSQKKDDMLKIIDYAIMLAEYNGITLDEVLGIVERRY